MAMRWACMNVAAGMTVRVLEAPQTRRWGSGRQGGWSAPAPVGRASGVRFVREHFLSVFGGRSIVLGCVLAGALASPGTALAQARPDSLRMTCAQARSIVATRGAVVIGTGPYIYDRFVADRRFCSLNEFARPAFIRSRDTPQCMVGYKCTPISDGWWW
ncbi:hypothetical protein [Alsobacter sp. R-9]